MTTSNKGPALDWCGQPLKPGGFYGGRAEFLPKERPDRCETITQDDLARVFENSALKRALAVKELARNTGASRASCYRALEEGGRFAKELRFKGDSVDWRRYERDVRRRGW
jgi:predicted DNA-binding transcriptional regulator AlpA